ncbi:MAG: hypothetical protein ACRD0Z_08135 [Acidimicrobiales bacterium]
MSDAVTLGVTGIVVSGVIGPAVAAWLSRRAELSRFRREQVVYQRNQLKALLDEAAVLLAKGPTNLRLLREAALDSPERGHANEWLGEVFPIGQRLQLWLPSDHVAVQVYDRVREALVTTAESADPVAIGTALAQFDELRGEFLDEARSLLLTPYSAQRGAR